MRRVKLTLSSLAMALGLLTIVATIAQGGGIGARGVVLGAVLAAMGGARFFLTYRHGI